MREDEGAGSDGDDRSYRTVPDPADMKCGMKRTKADCYSRAMGSGRKTSLPQGGMKL